MKRGEVARKIALEHLERTHDGLDTDEVLDRMIGDEHGSCPFCGFEVAVPRTRVRDDDRRPFVCDNCGEEVSLVAMRCPGCRLAFSAWTDATGDRERSARRV